MLVGTPDEVAAVLEELAGGSEQAAQLLVKKEEELGREALLAAARQIVLQTLDMLWVEHLESMEYLRGSVNLRAYGQRDPLVEYRKEGTQMYREMEMVLANQVFELIEKLTKEGTQGALSLGVTPTMTPVINLQAMGQEQAQKNEINRNDPCPCGSGKKWKNCGLKNTPEHQRLMAAKK